MLSVTGLVALPIIALTIVAFCARATEKVQDHVTEPAFGISLAMLGRNKIIKRGLITASIGFVACSINMVAGVWASPNAYICSVVSLIVMLASIAAALGELARDFAKGNSDTQYNKAAQSTPIDA